MAPINEASSCRVVEAQPGTSDVIATLLPAYLAELGVVEPYPYLALYFVEKDRYPFLFILGDDVAGFALVRHHSQSATFELAEFYVRPPFRHRGVGASAVNVLLARFNGKWQIGVDIANVRALAFWRKMLPPPVSEQLICSGQRCIFSL